MTNPELENFLASSLGKGLGARGVMQAAAARFPRATADEFGRALERAKSGCRRSSARSTATLPSRGTSMRSAGGLGGRTTRAGNCRKCCNTRPPPAMPMPPPCWRKYLNAAVAVHPDWSHTPDGSGWRGPKDKNHPERDPGRLIAWFERSYPGEAARITAETFDN
jgi:hypothetical protein